MPRERGSLVQATFTAGEMSPELIARAELAKYQNGAQALENCIVLKTGAARRRSGTVYVAPVKDRTAVTILQDFQYSVDQTYALEFGDQYIRFFRDHGQLEEIAGTPTEISSPYSTADLRELRFVQSADVLFITHPDYAPRQLARTSGDDTQPATWQLTEFTHRDGPYLDINDTTTTLTPAAVTGNTTIAASADVFVSTDVGRYIRLSNPAANEDWGYATITAVTDAQNVDVTVVKDFAQAGVATELWRLGAWSETTGYPWCATFYQERMWFGATNAQPQTLWSSRSSILNGFGPSKLADGSVRDTDAITRTVSSRQVNAIRDLGDDTQGLLLFTAGGSFTARPGVSGEAMTPTNCNIVPQTNFSVHSTVPPQQVGDNFLAFSRTGDRLRELRFSLEQDKMVAPNMSALSDHILLGGIVDAAAQAEPENIVWAVRADGELAGFTYEREHDVLGWHRHRLGGSHVDDADFAKVESIAVIRENDRDEIWLIVQRIINGETRRHVEYMKPLFTRAIDQEDAFFVDCGLTYDGAPATAISGLDHLEAASVDILADGGQVAQQQVIDGAITLPVAASVVHVGLPYAAEVEPNPRVLGSAAGDSRPNLHRVYKVYLYFDRTLGGSIEWQDTDVQELAFHQAGDAMGSAPALFTGRYDLSYTMPTSPEARLTIRHEGPLPFTLLSVMSDIEVSSV